MPNTSRNSTPWSYENFARMVDGDISAVVSEYTEDQRRAAAQRQRAALTGSPFRSGSPESINGLRWLADAENATRFNVTFDESHYTMRRTGFASSEFADYLKNRKGVYQFIKESPPIVNMREAAIRSYTAMRALRLPSASISRAARQYGAGELSRQACQTVRHFREDYREAMIVRPTGYKVVRWFENRKIEFYLAPPSRDVSRPEQWRQIKEQFREAIQRARAERRAAHVDTLAQKPTNFHLQKNALRMLKTYKKPDANVRSVGIEIECCIPRNADMTKLWPVAQYVNVTSDGSVHPDKEGYAAVEFRVCTPAFKMAEVITQMCKILNDMGARVNKTCGLHVHLDQRNRTPDEMKVIFSNFIRAQNLLFEVVPKSRRNNSYCKKHRGTDFDQATRGQRYKAINATAFRKHNTLEIRLFSGTVNAEKIINWVKTLWAIEAGQPVLRCPKTFDIAQRYWRIDADVLRWLKGRQEKFKDVPRDNTDVMDAEPIEEGN